jgi:hypothetical protein
LVTRRLPPYTPPQIYSCTTAGERVATDVEEKVRADGKLLYENFLCFMEKRNAIAMVFYLAGGVVRGLGDCALGCAETYERLHGRVIHLDEARKIGLRVESLAGEHLSAVYAVYNRLRDLFTFIDKSLTPLPDILRIISVTSYNLNHGLV